MALTDAQKASARYYLGYPDRYQETFFRLRSNLDDLSDDAVTLVGGLLTSLASIDTKLTSSWDRQKVSKAEEITLAGPDEIRALRGEGRRLVGRLAATLNVPVHADVFGEAGAGSGVCRRG